jgi:hypothetical protein
MPEADTKCRISHIEPPARLQCHLGGILFRGSHTPQIGPRLEEAEIDLLTPLTERPTNVSFGGQGAKGAIPCVADAPFVPRGDIRADRHILSTKTSLSRIEWRRPRFQRAL